MAAKILIETDAGVHWITVDVNGTTLPLRRGPYSADEAEAMATQLAGFCRTMLRETVAISSVPVTPPKRRRA